MEIKVLGTGCVKCKKLQRLTEDAVGELGVSANIEKVEDIAEIVSYGVMSTPGVIIDGELVHAGGIPSKEIITSWF